jgi:hypothetical protein
MASGNYYDLLDIPRTATVQQIRKAYRSKAKLFHPDVNLHSDSHMHFLILTQAYETLIDPNKRHLYDMALISNTEHLLTYEQWKEIERRKIKEEEALAYQDFLRRKELFQHSIYFKPAKVLLFIAPILTYLISIAIILCCIWLMWAYHPMFIFLFLPFLCLSIYVLFSTPKWVSASKKYF